MPVVRIIRSTPAPAARAAVTTAAPVARQAQRAGGAAADAFERAPRMDPQPRGRAQGFCGTPQMDADRFELPRKVKEALESRPGAQRQIESALERIGEDASLLHTLQVALMTDEELAGEVAAQEERYQEATTGAHQDEATAADAQARLERLESEQARRTLREPTLDAQGYSQALVDLTDGGLAAEQRRQEAILRDAQSGAAAGQPGAVADAAQAEQRLEAIRREHLRRTLADVGAAQLR